MPAGKWNNVAPLSFVVKGLNPLLSNDQLEGRVCLIVTFELSVPDD